MQRVLDALLDAIELAALAAGCRRVVRMPANVAHAVDAPEPSRMLLAMLREPQTA